MNPPPPSRGEKRVGYPNRMEAPVAPDKVVLLPSPAGRLPSTRKRGEAHPLLVGVRSGDRLQTSKLCLVDGHPLPPERRRTRFGMWVGCGWVGGSGGGGGERRVRSPHRSLPSIPSSPLMLSHSPALPRSPLSLSLRPECRLTTTLLRRRLLRTEVDR